MLKIINPFAGLLILSLCAVVKRGGRNHLVVELTNNAAELSMLLISTTTCPSGPPVVVTSIRFIYNVNELIAASIATGAAYVASAANDNPAINIANNLMFFIILVYKNKILLLYFTDDV